MEGLKIHHCSGNLDVPNRYHPPTHGPYLIASLLGFPDKADCIQVYFADRYLMVKYIIACGSLQHSSLSMLLSTVVVALANNRSYQPVPSPFWDGSCRRGRMKATPPCPTASDLLTTQPLPQIPPKRLSRSSTMMLLSTTPAMFAESSSLPTVRARPAIGAGYEHLRDGGPRPDPDTDWTYRCVKCGATGGLMAAHPAPRINPHAKPPIG